jgi:ribosome biogenesis GTPase A
MSTQNVLSPKLHEQLDALREILKSALLLTEKVLDKESSVILTDRLAHLQSAALFVIVGEVKSGKSSFVNALLGEEVCEVAPDPCTAGIQELVYGDVPNKITLGDHWERVYLPKPVLREITIVDTPGTNSIITNHQTITENYIPQSDLVIFVFPAKNPHTGTPWEFLALIRNDWHRKTVFVLQQADLASQHELSTNQERVKQYARQRNVQNPLVFTVSAKREKEGASDSGFAEFRRFLQKAVESGEVWRMKVDGARDTTRKVISKQLAALRKEEAAVAGDRAFYQGLVSKVKVRREKAHSLQRLVVESLAATYDRLSSSLEEDFAEGLGIGSVLRRSIPLIRDKEFRTWLKDLQSQFENRAKEEIEAESLRVSKDLSDEMQTMVDELLQSIGHRQKDNEESGLSRISGRLEVLERLMVKLKELRVSDIVGDKGIQGSDLGALTLAGGGIAAFGAIIALATNIMVFDITGGILATVGIGLVALTLLWTRPGIISEFRQKLAKSRAEFRDRLNREVAQIFEKLFLEIDHQLKEPLARLEKQAAHLSSLAEEAERISKEIEKL